MAPLMLPILPGSDTAALHPYNVGRVGYAVLAHSLRVLRPDTGVVRRAHHPPYVRTGNARSRHGDTNSVTSSRRTHRTATAGETGSEDNGGQPLRRHRTHSGDRVRSSRREGHHRTSSSASETEGNASRRTRSAEEPLAVARRTSREKDPTLPPLPPGSTRRSHSDGVRSRHRRTPDGVKALDSKAITMSSNSSAAGTAATPGASHGLGKPPLSKRQHSTQRSTSAGRDGGMTASEGDETADGETTRHQPRHHRSSRSSTGTTRHRHHRSSSSGPDDAGSDRDGSVIIIGDATAGARWLLRGWPGVGWLQSTSDKARPRRLTLSPFGWWRHLRKQNVTNAAYLLDHVLRAVPVMMVHYLCELKRQLVTLPLLRFSDAYIMTMAQGGDGVTAGADSMDEVELTAVLWPPAEEAVEQAPVRHLGHLLLTRWVMQATESYIEKLCFLDESVAVGQLRSRRLLRRVAGWSLRIASHTVLDPFFLSIVIPLLISGAAAESPQVPPRALITVPGVARGLAMSACSVFLQLIVMPEVSRLVYRAAVTGFEVGEYLIMRRYTHWSDEEEEIEDENDLEEDGRADDITSLASGGSAATAMAADAAAAHPTDVAEARVKKEQRRLRREKRQRRLQRAEREAAREQSMRRTVLRAIIFRMISSVISQVVVDHPMSVLVELLRGRATLHLLGLLAGYSELTEEADGCTWVNFMRYFKSLGDACGPEEDGVPALVLGLRHVGQVVAQETVVVTNSVVRNSGQRPALTTIMARGREMAQLGESTTAKDSAHFLFYSLLALKPFYYGVQFTVMDKVLSFYMAVWTRLSKQ